jgi:hypothetical protein
VWNGGRDSKKTPPQDAPPLADPLPVSTARGVPAELAEGAVQRLEEQLREATDRHLRLAAEFDNFRKRVARERLELADRAQAALVIKLLDILDDVDRIVASDPNTPAPAYSKPRCWSTRSCAGVEAAGPSASTRSASRSIRPSMRRSGAARPSGAGSHRRRHLSGGLPLPRRLVRPARVQVYSSEGHAWRRWDFYQVLGVSEKATPAGNQESLPQAGHSIIPTRPITCRPPRPSSRSPKPTGCSPIPRSGRSMTPCAGWARSTRRAGSAAPGAGRGGGGGSRRRSTSRLRLDGTRRHLLLDLREGGSEELQGRVGRDRARDTFGPPRWAARCR